MTAPTTTPVEVDKPVEDPDLPWIVLVWNDPINLMSYVTFVFQKLFGYSLEKATKLMLDVHNKGRAVVTSGTREHAEVDVARLHRRIERRSRGGYRVHLGDDERALIAALPRQIEEILAAMDPSSSQVAG